MGCTRFLAIQEEREAGQAKDIGRLSEGRSITQAIEQVFSDLNRRLTLGLRTSTIAAVSEKIGSLASDMELDNVAEIYSTFVHRYVFRDGAQLSPNKLDDEKILIAANELRLSESNGYFVLSPDSQKDIERKSPERQ